MSCDSNKGWAHGIGERPRGARTQGAASKSKGWAAYSNRTPAGPWTPRLHRRVFSQDKRVCESPKDTLRDARTRLGRDHVQRAAPLVSFEQRMRTLWYVQAVPRDVVLTTATSRYVHDSHLRDDDLKTFCRCLSFLHVDLPNTDAWVPPFMGSAHAGDITNGERK